MIKSNPLFYKGSRLNNIKRVQLRMKCSKLNADLFLLHVVDSPECICGNDVENSDFLLNAHLIMCKGKR